MIAVRSKLGLALAAALAASTAIAAPVITLTQISTPFNGPIGIDYYEPTNSVLISANYPSGLPSNLETIAGNGTHTPFSTLSGGTDEVKVATVQSGYTTGFAVGDVFTGNGSDGQIVRITGAGTTLLNPWVSLPGGGNGLMRGSLYVDRTGVYNGDLIVVTTAGEVWRVDAAGNPTFINDVNVHLEGVMTVPNDAARYGPIAGCIIAGAEGQGLMHSWCPVVGAFTHTTYNLGVAIEDIDLIDGSNFFGVNFGTGRILGAPASQFAGLVGDILLTQEFHSGSGLFRLTLNGAAFVTEQFTLGAGSAPVGQWEHVTFARAGINEVPPVNGVPEPATAGLIGLGLALLGWARRRSAKA